MWRKLGTRSVGTVLAVVMIYGCGNHYALVDSVDEDAATQKVRYDGPPRLDDEGLAIGTRVPELTCERSGDFWVCGQFCPYDCTTWERACLRAAVYHRGRDIAVCDSCDEDTCR